MGSREESIAARVEVSIPALWFRGNYRRERLRKLLGAGATEYLLNVWMNSAVYSPSGVLEGMHEEDIAEEARWEGDPIEFVDALIKSGFLAQDENGVYFLKCWKQVSGKKILAGFEESSR